MEINNLMDLGAMLMPSAKGSSEASKSNDSTFYADMQKAVEKANQRMDRKGGKGDVRADTQTSETDKAQFADQGAEKAEKPDQSEDTNVDDTQGSDDTILPEEEMAAMIAPFIPIITQSIEAPKEPEQEETILVDNIGSMFIDNDDIGQNVINPEIEAKEEEEAPLADGNTTEQDAGFVENILKDIKQAVASNDAERTVSAEPEAEPIEEAQEKPLASEYDDNKIVETEEGSEEAQDAIKPVKSTKTERAHRHESSPATHTAVHLDADAPEAEVALKDGAIAPREAQQAFFESVLEQVRTAVNDERSELFIQLKPEVLGGLAIRLIMTNEGLSAQVRTSNQQLQSMVHNEIAQLEANLKDKGIEVVQMDVIYDQSASNSYLNERQHERWDDGRQPQRGSQNGVRIVEETAAFNPYEQLYESMVPVEEGGTDSVEFSA